MSHSSTPKTILSQIYLSTALSGAVLGGASAAEAPVPGQGADTAPSVTQKDDTQPRVVNTKSYNLRLIKNDTRQEYVAQRAEAKHPQVNAPQESLFPSVKSVVASVSQDSAFMKGDTDNNGDYKAADSGIRFNNGVYVGSAFALETAQKGAGKDAKLYDTTFVKAIVGYETPTLGLYGFGGVANGKMANGIVDSIVGTVWEGGGAYGKRFVDKETILLGAQVRYDVALTNLPIGESGWSAVPHVAAFGEVSTMRTSGGVAAFLTVQETGRPDPKQNLYNMPKLDDNGQGLNGYVGVAIEGVGHDLPTSYAGTRPYRARFMVGGNVPLTDQFSLFAQATVSTSEVKGIDTRPVARFDVGARYNFSSSDLSGFKF